MDASDWSSEASSVSFGDEELECETFNTKDELLEDLTSENRGDVLSSGDEAPEAPNGGKENKAKTQLKPRNYQLEMLQESLKRNIIVAMDTGSGKTHIAVLRIIHELERMGSDQLIWFLAPTIPLCSQQFQVLKSQITAVQIQFLSGNDGVERWTEKPWRDILQGTKIIVSTYQILLDALTHAFINIKRLALIVFDEAHNCIKKNAGAKIMHSFYHPAKFKGECVPWILGLTASPVMNSSPKSLIQVEATLDAICRTPTRHRSELQLQVKLPEFRQVYYHPPSEVITLAMTRSLLRLKAADSSWSWDMDPYVLALIDEKSERSRRKLEKLRLNHKTWTREQLKKLCSMSQTIFKELGSWAADYYLARVINNVVKLIDGGDGELIGGWDVSGSEKQYLALLLKKAKIPPLEIHKLDKDLLVSDKVAQLINTLDSDFDNFRGIVFVRERATAEVLTALLNHHRRIRDKFRVGSMVGTSANANRNGNIADIVDLKAQKPVLDRYRTGEINLVVATSVLEEGIDVPACNVVICFDEPANLKSFVQRRGRARQRESKLILLLNRADSTQRVMEFQALEEEMKMIYANEMRTLVELAELEDTEEIYTRTYHVQSTGALLDLDNAVTHLYHFCATLPASDFVDSRPDFFCYKGKNLIKAKVILPLSVDRTLRTAESLLAWKTEKNAIKDAAFEAYVALHKAGLINDHLLPFEDEDAEDLLETAQEKRPSLMDVNEQLNPWVYVAKHWNDASDVRQSVLLVGDLGMTLFLPVKLPPINSFLLYWDRETELEVKIRDVSISDNHQILAEARTYTNGLLKSTFGRRFPVDTEPQVVCFYPRNFNAFAPSPTNLAQYKYSQTASYAEVGLIRDKLDKHITYVYKGYLSTKPSIFQVQQPYHEYLELYNDEPHISVRRLSKRRDFLHKVAADTTSISTKPHSAILPISRCEPESTPFQYSRFGLLLPSITHRVGIRLLAQELSGTILKPVKISNLDYIETAICASSAQEPTNYQRLEFLGDSILKVCTAIQLMAAYPLWHEGLLSSKDDQFIANRRLARACVESGLDKFIVTKQFNGGKWRPLYVQKLLEQPDVPPKRELSSKTLADVVEALIGAATLDGGMVKALACLSIFIPELDWQSLRSRQLSLYESALRISLPTTLEPVEKLLGYTFRKKSLLIEALTHASFKSASGGSLERLEYLGDAILDNIIATELWEYNLSHGRMHTIRTAMVNADFLAWICLETSIEVDVPSITADLETKITKERCALWRFLRQSSPSLSKSQQETVHRHLSLRDEIERSIEEGSEYPWALLSRLDAMKFFSDMLESLLGAVWIDSHDDNDDNYTMNARPRASASGKTKFGSDPIFRACKSVLENLGVLRYMRRILRDGVHALHPKEELGILANDKTVKYVLESRGFALGGGEKVASVGSGSEEEADDDEINLRNTSVVSSGTVEYVCTIFVGDEEIVKVDGGISMLEVKTRAAGEAVKILRRRGRERGEETRGEEIVADDVGGVSLNSA